MGWSLANTHISNPRRLPSGATEPAIVCFSHLRWDFVYHRPHHLLSRFARERHVLFIEPPTTGLMRAPFIETRSGGHNIEVAVPHLPEGLSSTEKSTILQSMVDDVLSESRLDRFIAWYDTPAPLVYTRHLAPEVVVYDCMTSSPVAYNDNSELPLLDQALLKRADLVFTGGQTLYELLSGLHEEVHLFPGSVDRAHFSRAKQSLRPPVDQNAIPHPRIGYFGVIDERIDTQLLAKVAEMRPDWQFVLVGPATPEVAQRLPQASNLHYLGRRAYEELPNYVAGWDVAILPFAVNEVTRYCNPTKILGYLAGGRPVVSSAIPDVVAHYSSEGLVHIAADAEGFVRAVEEASAQKHDNTWLNKVERYLARTSWERTHARIAALIERATRTKRHRLNASPGQERHIRPDPQPPTRAVA